MPRDKIEPIYTDALEAGALPDPTTRFKSDAAFLITDLKAEGEEKGEFSGLASTFNNTDLHGDIMIEGAFKNARASGTRMLWQHDTDTVTLTLIEPTILHLERLVATGLYGNNRAEAAKIILLNHLSHLVENDKIEKLTPVAKDQDAADKN